MQLNNSWALLVLPGTPTSFPWSAPSPRQLSLLSPLTPLRTLRQRTFHFSFHNIKQAEEKFCTFPPASASAYLRLCPLTLPTPLPALVTWPWSSLKPTYLLGRCIPSVWPTSRFFYFNFPHSSHTIMPPSLHCWIFLISIQTCCNIFHLKIKRNVSCPVSHLLCFAVQQTPHEVSKLLICTFSLLSVLTHSVKPPWPSHR